MGSKVATAGLGFAGGTLFGGKILHDISRETIYIYFDKVLSVMRGDMVLVVTVVDGVMVWDLWDIILDMGRLTNIQKIVSILNNIYFSGFGIDNDTTIINN